MRSKATRLYYFHSLLLNIWMKGTIPTPEKREIHQPIKFKFCRLAHRPEAHSWGESDASWSPFGPKVVPIDSFWRDLFHSYIKSCKFFVIGDLQPFLFFRSISFEVRSVTIREPRNQVKAA
jgi:hypothetical protein